MQIASTFICDSRGSNFKFKRTQLTKILGVSQSSAPPPLFLLILSIDDIESLSCANHVLNVLSALSHLSSLQRWRHFTDKDSEVPKCSKLHRQ